MPDETLLLERIVEKLRARQVEPILVGGLAMVLFASRRVTQDIDFVVKNSAENRARITEAMYEAGLELGTWLDGSGRVSETVSDANLAKIRARDDSRTSELFFLEPESRQEVDILLDFPFPADELAANAVGKAIGSTVVLVASPVDLLRMKRKALSERNEARDVQDVEYLEKLIASAN